MDHILTSLYELKGRLKARRTILDSEITFTQRLAEAMVTDHYNGYARGRTEAYQEWLRSVDFLIAEVEELITEAQRVEKENCPPF